MSLWNNCKLEGLQLDLRVARLEGLKRGERDGKCVIFTPGPPDPIVGVNDFVHFSPSTQWHWGGPIIERDHIFLQPPHSEHRCGGPEPGLFLVTGWRATVSAAKRTKPNGHVGRGEGPTALIAAMRAYVDSWGQA